MNTPEMWQDVLARIKTANPNIETAMIAGGCIRDYFIGIQPKDIDVFVRYGPRNFTPFQLPRDFGFADDVQPDNEEYDDTAIINTMYFSYNNTLINVIVLDAHVEVADYITTGFDVAICKGRVTDNGNMFLPYQMLQDLNNKTLTVTNPSAGTTRRLTRFLTRIGAVEQGWRAVYPERAPNNIADAIRLLGTLRAHTGTQVRPLHEL